MSKRVVVGALLALLVVLAANDASARCAMRSVEASLLTPRDHRLASDGALVVALVPSQNGSSPTSFPALTLVRGDARIALRGEPLSPTVALYVPERRPRPGRWRVDGLTGGRVTFGSGVAGEVSAPRLHSVEYWSTDHGRGRLTYSLKVRVAAPLREGIIAAIPMHGGEVVGGAGVAAGETELTLFFWHRRCQGWPDGLNAPPSSGEVAVILVDADGQTSAPSNAIGITTP